jgi:hypothetical protein
MGPAMGLAWTFGVLLILADSQLRGWDFLPSPGC